MTDKCFRFVVSYRDKLDNSCDNNDHDTAGTTYRKILKKVEPFTVRISYYFKSNRNYNKN